METRTSNGVLTVAALVAVAMAGVLITAGPTRHASGAGTSKAYPTLHKTITVDGVDIFYREAGRRTPRRSCCSTDSPRPRTCSAT
jgi:hypothetical protein